MTTALKPPNWVFWSIWGLDLAVGFVFFYFFVNDIKYLSSSNIGVWLTIFGILGAVLVGSAVLRAKGHGILATGVACFVALPAVCFALFFLMILITNPSMH